MGVGTRDRTGKRSIDREAEPLWEKSLILDIGDRERGRTMRDRGVSENKMRND